MSEPTITLTASELANVVAGAVARALAAAGAPPPATLPAPPEPTPVPAPAALEGTAGEYVDTATAAAMLGISPRALEAWRLRGQGPMFARLGRAVRYRVADVRAFAAAGERR